MSKEIPELNELLNEVEKRYNRKISTTTDFEALSVVIEHEINEMISASTLKRLWGYVSSKPIPRASTLDILSRYIGKRNFLDFCDYLKSNATVESGNFTSKFITASELNPGDQVTIGWNPNRLVELIYLGSFRFKVMRAENSQLIENDEFEATSFSLGYPLYIPFIIRNGEKLPSYIAGSINGITTLQ